MDWIINRDSFVFDLSNDQRLLDLLGELDNQKLNDLTDQIYMALGAAGGVYANVRDIASPFQLLQLFAKDGQFSNNVAVIESKLDALGVESQGLVDLVGKARAWIEDIPEAYKKLLRPVGDFVEETANTNPGLVDWQLLEADTNKARTLAKGVALKFAGSGSASLQFEAGHKASSADDKRYLRIGLAAEADAKASASIPVNLGSIALGAGASGQLDVNYLIASSSANTIYAKALGSSISSIANPLDFNALWTNMMADDLRGLRVKAKGAAYGTTSIGLVKKADIPNLGTGSAGLKFDAEIRHGGEYRFDVQRVGDSLIELSLANTRETASSMGVSLVVIVNAKLLAKKINKEIGPRLEKINGNYQKLDEYLEPGKVIREEIKTKVNKLTNQELTAKLLRLGLGSASVKDVKKKLAGVIEGAISTRSAVWKSRAEDGAESLMSELTARYPILADPEIEGKLQKTLSDLIRSVTSKLETEVKAISQRDSGLLNALEASGVEVNKALDSADEALRGMRRALKEYHSKVEKILKGLEKYATSEIKIELQSQSMSASGTGVSLTAQFTSNTKETQDAYTALLGGDLDKILELNRKQPDGLTIELEEWQRFANFERRSSWNLSVLDISLGAETMFSTKSRISIDDDGVIGVLSEGEWTRRRRAYRESREFGFVDAYRLLVAKQTRTLNANLKLSQQDENTQREELSQFLGRLEEFGLVQADTSTAAENLLSRWEGDAADTDIKTNIAAKLRLSDVEMKKLIGLEAPPTELRDEYFVSLAYTFLKKAGLVTQDEINHAVPALRNMPSVNADELSPTELIAKYTPGHRRQWVAGIQLDNDVREALQEIERLHDKAIALKDMVFALRDIWSADPNTGADADYYRSRQEVIDRSLREWVRIGSTFIFWLSNQVHRSTLAFLLCVTFLSDIRGRAPMIVTISRDDGDDRLIP